MAIFNTKEGWHQIGEDWHYFRSGITLCWSHLLIKHPDMGYRLDKDVHITPCGECDKRRTKELEDIERKRPPNDWQQELHVIETVLRSYPDTEANRRALKAVKTLLHRRTWNDE